MKSIHVYIIVFSVGMIGASSLSAETQLTGDYRNALVDFNQVLKLEPNNQSALRQKKKILNKIKERDGRSEKN